MTGEKCRPFEVVVDGEPLVVSVRGAAPMSDADREALAEVVRAAVAKAKADLEPVEDPGYIEDMDAVIDAQVAALRCDACGGALAIATAVCTVCGADPYGYYLDECPVGPCYLPLGHDGPHYTINV